MIVFRINSWQDSDFPSVKYVYPKLQRISLKSSVSSLLLKHIALVPSSGRDDGGGHGREEVETLEGVEDV
ncbi:hypothetical protein AAC387_Pa11g0829 [Persea americana]